MIFYLLYLLFALQFRNHCYLPHISLVRTLQVLFREGRQSISGDWFSVLIILIIHKFDLALHASLMIFFFPPYSMCLLFLIIIIIIIIIIINLGVKMQGILFFLFLACQILYVFLPDISVHCALIDYAYMIESLCLNICQVLLVHLNTR
jgi:hypothetical protein